MVTRFSQYQDFRLFANQVDLRPLLDFEAAELRSHMMDIMGLHLGL